MRSSMRVVVPGAVLALLALLTFEAALAAPARSKSKSSSASSKAKATTPADTVLVRVGGEAITASQVHQRLAELPEQVRPTYATPDGRQRLLDRMVEERVWMLTAVKKGVPARPEVVRQLEQQKRDLIIRTYVSEVMAGNAAPSDSEAKVYYDAHAGDYRIPATVTISHIQLKTEPDARKVLGLARAKGANWNALTLKWSVDSLTRKTNGALGVVTHEGVFGALGAQPALAESAFALGEGRIGGPYRSDKGWHVVRVDAVKLESLRPFDQVRGQIVRQISAKRSQEYYQGQLQQAEHALGVSADSAAIKSFLVQKKSARDRFNEAQSAGTPAQRIDQYQALLTEYPDSDVSPQAQFMIGFIQSEELKDFEAADKSFKALLQRYPKSELAASAQWMIDHMRTEGAPAFMNLEGDSTTSVPAGKKGSANKP